MCFAREGQQKIKQIMIVRNNFNFIEAKILVRLPTKLR